MNRNLCKKEIIEVYTKHLEKKMLFYSSLIFLKTAFVEATENKRESLVKALTQFRDAMPESLKEMHTDDAPDYERYFYNLHFIELVSNIELFLVEAITVIVNRYPNKIGRQQVLLSDVIALGKSNKIVEKACTEYLNGLTYKKPNDYKKEFLKLISADEDLLDDEWPKFIEMKARRDLGVHNDWRINDTYKRKIKESGFPGLPNQLYMYPSEEYIDVCLKLAESIYRKVYEHILQKYS